MSTVSKLPITMEKPFSHAAQIDPDEQDRVNGDEISSIDFTR